MVAVDQALLVKPHKDLKNRVGVALIECEPFLRVVTGSTNALKLANNPRAVLLAPLPDPLNKGFTANFLTAGPFLYKRLLNLLLRRNPSMVCPEDPLGVVTQHAVVANENILDSPVERVPHVE
ncbi:unannotated protein [freshwater metagenome]|uniref:Unannotated protein n=1 Tax=freshwater metagenome TaxID=449393 RepID=A0A6J7EKJ8_9ZZZZ